MKIKRLDLSKRDFFAKVGLGLLSGVVVSKIPFKKTLSESDNTASNKSDIKVKINPLAVKRKNKDS